MNKIFAIILLLLLFPIFLIVSVLILIDDGFPIFFKQRRVGKNNKIFKIIKFRTMNINTKDIASHLASANNIKFNRFGPFLRKYSFDELPQLFNIINGDMTFIGPRPALYNQKDLNQLRTSLGIHTIKPGITGWAQINGRDQLNISEKADLDLFYFNNKSFIFDLKILVLTVLKVFKSEGVI